MRLFELVEKVSDEIDRGDRDCFELEDFEKFKDVVDWELLKVIIKEENEEGFSDKWNDLKEMSGIYKLEEVGGMNSEVLMSEVWFESLKEVMEYFKKNDVRDDDGNLVEKLEEEGWYDSWFDGRGGELFKRDYVVCEGLVLMELKGK